MRSITLLVTLTAAVLSASCSGPEPAASSPSTGFDLPGLDLRLTSVPAGLARGDRAGLLLVTDPARGGRVLVGVQPPEEGVNLVEAIHEHQAWVEAQPEGRYFGAQELVTPLGTAFWTRGRWRGEDGREVEEAVALALHPDRTRIVRLGYRYPAADDSSARVTELLELLGSLEEIPSEAREPAG